MLKPYITVLSAYIPTASEIEGLETTSIKGLAAAFAVVEKLLPKPKIFASFITQKQFRIKSLVATLLQVPAILLIICTFLFVSPHTQVLANWEEKVIADNRALNITQITAEITAVEIPHFQMPVKATYVSTYFSRFHQGIDLPNPYGSIVTPIASGKVVFAGASNLGYGNMVVVRHELGYESLYAHLADVSVKEGDKVGANSAIGYVGATGLAFGNHLHLEVHLQGQAVNPLTLFK